MTSKRAEEHGGGSLAEARTVDERGRERKESQMYTQVASKLVIVSHGNFKETSRSCAVCDRSMA